MPRSGKAARVLADLVAGTPGKHHPAMSSQAIAYHRTISKRERSIAFYKPRPARDAKRRGKYYPLRNAVTCVQHRGKDVMRDKRERSLYAYGKR